jgi:septum formation protein
MTLSIIKSNMPKYNPKIILASTSPRRKEIMEKTGLSFAVVESNYEEDMTLPLKPRQLVKKLSLGKAEAVAHRHLGAVVIAADTFIVFGDKVMGKPKTVAQAKTMLKHLSGKSNTILTGLTILRKKPYKLVSRIVETKIFFRKLTEKEIVGYIKTGEPMDKAGAYAVQGLGAMFIDKIVGEFSGAMGLPLGALNDGLKEFKINIL